MTGPSLPAALRAGADGIYTAEAATGLIIACGSWLARDDYASFITAGTSISSPGTVLAGIDWDAAIDTLSAGRLPSSGGERRVLQLAASLARDIPVRLGDAVTGIDQRNVGLLVKAIRHVSGRRQFS
jgi:hypothetical protein